MATTSGKAGLFAFDPARCDAMSEVLAQRWWAVGLRGILAIIFGLICLLTPGIALGAFVIVFAAYMFVDGVFAIISGIRAARLWDYPSANNKIVSNHVEEFAWPIVN